MIDLYLYQRHAYDELLRRDRAVLLTSMGLGSRHVVAKLAAARGLKTQLVDTRSMKAAWDNIWQLAEFDDVVTITPQLLGKHGEFPYDPSREDVFTIIHLEAIGYLGTLSATTLRKWRDELMRGKWVMIAHDSNVLKHAPLISRLFPDVEQESLVVLGMDGEQTKPMAELRQAYWEATNEVYIRAGFAVVQRPGKYPLNPKWGSYWKWKEGQRHGHTSR